MLIAENLAAQPDQSLGQIEADRFFVPGRAVYGHQFEKRTHKALLVDHVIPPI
jgi:hypothetical protein